MPIIKVSKNTENKLVLIGYILLTIMIIIMILKL